MTANSNPRRAITNQPSAGSGWAVVVGPSLLTAFLLTASAPGWAHGRAQALLAWPAFLPLLAILPKLTLGQATLAGFIAGTAMFLGWASWLPGLMARFSGWSASASVLAACGLACAHGVGWALWSMLVRYARGRLPMPFVAAAAFVVMERWFPCVFPWSLGLAHYQFRDLAQVAELGGPCVLTFLEVGVAAAMAEAAWALRDGRARAWRGLAVAAIAICVALGFGRLRRTQIDEARTQAPSAHVGAIQAGAVVSGWRKQVQPDLLVRYRKATTDVERAAGRFDFLIWPEKASPVLRKDAVHDYPGESPRRIGDGYTSAVLFGAEAMDVGTRDRWNAAALLAPDGRLRVVYAKVKLIPWSEWLPGWGELWWGKRYQAGTTVSPVLLPLAGQHEGDTVPAGVFICFEAAFPAYVRQLVAGGARLLVNLSDDSWFGDSAEPEQHLAHAVFRAIESRRDLIRAAGAGISAHITATGLVERSLPISRGGDPVAVLGAEPRLLQGHSLHQRLGDAFALACACLTVVALGLTLVDLAKAHPR